MTKKSFTLIELMISIAIFSIVMIFLYQSLNLAQKFNITYANKVDNIGNIYIIKNIIYKDILKATNKIEIKTDDDGNSILMFKSNNLFHNPFSINVTYVLSSNHKLLRIESQKKIDIKKLRSSFFYDKLTYIDIVTNNIKKFIVLQKGKNKFGIFVQTMDNQELLFGAKNFYGIVK